MCVRRVHDLRLRLHHVEETAESGKAFLHHFDQFYKDLYGTDENADVQGVHGEIRRVHPSLGDEITAEHKGDEVHHALKEQIPSHEASHTVVIVALGDEEGMIALFKLIALDFLICKGLHHTDAGQCVLKAGVDVPDLPAVLHKCLLHPAVLAEGEEEHTEYKDDQRKGKHPVDEEEEHKGTDDLHHGYEQVFRSVVREFRDIEQVGHQLAHHLPGVVLTVIGEGQFFIMIKKLLAHVPLHVRTHHVPLIAHIIFAQALDDVHDQKSGGDERECAQDDITVLCKKCLCHCAEDLRIGQINHTDKCGADQVNKKDRFVRRIIIDEFFKRVHIMTPYMF